jgi:Oxidoreductase molybdopterin binding domain
MLCAAWFGALLVFALCSMLIGTSTSLPNPATVYAAQDAVPQPTVLKVEGAVPTPLALTANDLARMPRSTATLASDGATDTYEGVLLYDILVKAGFQFGRGMVGKGAPVCLIATGSDGFQAVFSLAEIDPQFSGVKVLVADKENGLPLPDRYKPFRIIAPQDKLRARSIYSLIKLEVVKLSQ